MSDMVDQDQAGHLPQLSQSRYERMHEQYYQDDDDQWQSVRNEHKKKKKRTLSKCHFGQILRKRVWYCIQEDFSIQMICQKMFASKSKNALKCNEKCFFSFNIFFFFM